MNHAYTNCKPIIWRWKILVGPTQEHARSYGANQAVWIESWTAGHVSRRNAPNKMAAKNFTITGRCWPGILFAAPQPPGLNGHHPGTTVQISHFPCGEAEMMKTWRPKTFHHFGLGFALPWQGAKHPPSPTHVGHGIWPWKQRRFWWWILIVVTRNGVIKRGKLGTYGNIYLKKHLWSSGWWFEPLWKILVSWDHYSQYMGK